MNSNPMPPMYGAPSVQIPRCVFIQRVPCGRVKDIARQRFVTRHIFAAEQTLNPHGGTQFAEGEAAAQPRRGFLHRALADNLQNALFDLLGNPHTPPE